MINLKQFEVWFLTGSQHLYGAEAIERIIYQNPKSFLSQSPRFML